MSEPENSKMNNLIISESNYSCEYFDEDFIKQKNSKAKKLYNLEEKEREIYDNQEELSHKMYKIISLQKKQFNSKFNKLKKEGEFYQHYYYDYNNKIKNMFNNYNTNNPILDILSEFNKNWIFPENNNNLNNNVFKKECNIKSYKKNLIQDYNKNKYKSKSCSKLIKTNRTTMNNSLNCVKIQNNNNINKYKTERNSKFNSAIKISSRIKPKNRTARTTAGNSNYKININDEFTYKKNNPKFLTKNNFYPKKILFNLGRDNDNSKLNFDNNNGYNSTKTSFRYFREITNLQNKYNLKKFESQYNFYNFNINDKKVEIRKI
jgi:hypothetical protein